MDNVSMPLGYARVHRHERKQRAEEALAGQADRILHMEDGRQKNC